MVIIEKNCFILCFFSDKLSYATTYVFKKFLIPYTFKDVRWQNIFNRYKVHQISPPMVDYA